MYVKTSCVGGGGIGFVMWTPSDPPGYSILTSLEISMMNARGGYYNSLGKSRLRRCDRAGFDESVDNVWQKQHKDNDASVNW